MLNYEKKITITVEQLAQFLEASGWSRRGQDFEYHLIDMCELTGIKISSITTILVEVHHTKDYTTDQVTEFVGEHLMNTDWIPGGAEIKKVQHT